jgi:hypothetical protein
MTEPALPYVLISAVLLVGLAQRLYALARDPTDPLRRAICVVLAGLLLATVVQLFTAALDGATGVVHLSWALADVGAMVSACAGQLFLLHVDHPAAEVRDRARRRYLGLAAALAAAVLLFVAFPPRPGQEAPFYDVVYIGYVATVLVPVLRLGVRYSGRTDRPSLRVGLRVVAGGSAVGLAFLAVMGVELVGGVTEASAPLLAQLATVLELAAVVLLMVGVTMTAWGPALGGARRWLADHRSYRQLRPLWQALHDADPGFALLPARRPITRWWPTGSDGDIGLLLYRRVIEIRDGQFAVGPYVDPAAVTRAGEQARRAGLAPDEVRAVVEAAAIASGIAAKAGGRPPRDAAPPAGPGPGDARLTAEIAWLRRVAQAFTRSPVVAEVRRTAAAAPVV